MPTDQTQPKRKRKAHPFSERKRVVELYESGLGCKRIAQAMGLDYQRFIYHIRRFRPELIERRSRLFLPVMPTVDAADSLDSETENKEQEK